jgi:hypothetical protein
MGILNFEDPEELDVGSKPTSPVDNQASTPVYDQATQPAVLTVDMEGEPWVVEYYNQLLTSSESPKPLDTGLDATLQQYHHITSFILSVTDPLSSSVDNATGLTEVTGAGIIYPNTVVPHIGDMFIAKLETGFYGLFTLTQVTRATFYKLSSFQVEYRLFEQLDSTLKADIEAKSVTHSYFDRNRIAVGKSPLVSYRATNLETRYQANLHNAIDLLYMNFYDGDRKTFIYKEEERKGYDGFACAFFDATIDSAYLRDYPSIVVYDLGIPQPLKKPTLWRALLRGEKHGISFLYPREFLPKDPGSLVNTYILRSVAHARIDVTPIPEKWVGFTIDRTTESYVLSHAFYDEDTANQTNLEKAVSLIMDRKTVPDTLVRTLSEEAETLTGKTQFYHLILLAFILCTLIKEG